MVKRWFWFGDSQQARQPAHCFFVFVFLKLSLFPLKYVKDAGHGKKTKCSLALCVFVKFVATSRKKRKKVNLFMGGSASVINIVGRFFVLWLAVITMALTMTKGRCFEFG